MYAAALSSWSSCVTESCNAKADRVIVSAIAFSVSPEKKIHDFF
jgi:hypothetical protein